jgi:hypothetical protein
MKHKICIIIFICIFCSSVLHAQSGPHIIYDEREGKVIFYGDGTEPLEEIYIDSYENELQELKDSGEYQMEFDDHGMHFQGVTIIAGDIALIQDHIESYVLPVVESSTVYNSYGEAIYAYPGDIGVLYSASGHYVVIEEIIVEETEPGPAYGFDIYSNDVIFIFDLTGKPVKEIKLDLKDKKSRCYAMLNKQESLYLTFTASQIIILDLETFKILSYPLLNCSKPDFDLASAYSWIQDFFIIDNNLHMKVKQFDSSYDSEHPASFIIEVIWQF